MVVLVTVMPSLCILLEDLPPTQPYGGSNLISSSLMAFMAVTAGSS
jgi:hypothetical protein